MKPEVTQAQLKLLLHYEAATGVFTWIRPNPQARKVRPGDVAGRLLKAGYVQIGIDSKYYLAHRLAFLYMLGRFPVSLVDHENGDTKDNSWKNLKEANPTSNSKNASKSKRNTSGVTGVNWNIGAKKWVASISINKIHTHLGCFDDLEKATAARKAAEQHHGYHPNHGRTK